MFFYFFLGFGIFVDVLDFLDIDLFGRYGEYRFFYI